MLGFSDLRWACRTPFDLARQSSNLERTIVILHESNLLPLAVLERLAGTRFAWFPSSWLLDGSIREEFFRVCAGSNDRSILAPDFQFPRSCDM